jgi:hypothetical protein
MLSHWRSPLEMRLISVGHFGFLEGLITLLFQSSLPWGGSK